MLDERLGVPVPLVDDALGLIVVEVDFVLQGSGVLGPHDLHALSGQALELLELALVELEPSDTLKLTHPCGLPAPAVHPFGRDGSPSSSRGPSWPCPPGRSHVPVLDTTSASSSGPASLRRTQPPPARPAGSPPRPETTAAARA